VGKQQSGHDSEQIYAAFRAYLQQNGIKRTKARDSVLEAVLGLDEHFEAEQVLYRLREKGLKVGKATVYRTLPLLVDSGILKQVRFDVKQAHYEHAFGEDPHDHMVCRRCGRIVEFAADEVLELRLRIGRRFHFHVISHRFQLSGLCWDCSIKCPVAVAPVGSPSPDEPSGDEVEVG
jgi:Fur family ferric uptake transcriptional regulator